MFRTKRVKKQTAFTLAETILVTIMIGVITMALYQALISGLKIWERSRVFFVDEDIMVFLEKLTMDLRNSFDFSLFEFEAAPERIIFSTIVSVPMARPGSREVLAYADQIGRVEYGFDPRTKAVYRREAHYGQAVQGVFGEKKILARPVSRMAFKYFERGQLGVSEKKLDRETLPAVMEVELEYEDAQGRRQKIVRMINLPLFL